MPTLLTPIALRELEALLASSRRGVSEIYREWKAGLTPQVMAEQRGHQDLKRVKENLSALRVLFGREMLPKRGKGRQLALNEAHHWLHSDSYLSPELQDHFEQLLLRGERTNSRRDDLYEPLLPPMKRSVYQQARKNRDKSGIYVVSREDFLLGKAQDDPILLKVGWSNNVWDRLSSLQTWDPDPITVLRVFFCNDPNVLEARIHICLDTLGLSYEGGGGREWFTAPLSLIDELASALGLESDRVTPEES